MQQNVQSAMKPEIIEKIQTAGVVAVLVIDQLQHTIPLANALLAGGIDAIELTLRTPIALDAAKLVKAELPQITLGLGTVITVDQVKEAVDIGADFAVAPGCNPTIIAAAKEHGLSFAPGVVTPTDIELAIEQGCRILKYFPAETAGGMKYLSNISAPYQHMDLKFIPLGGIKVDNVIDYLHSPLIAAIGGSWIAPRSMIRGEDWEGIKQNAMQIRSLISELRSKN
jgi:2-dehydro-3-deoxyphosphogluconate aldolase/(4S)-4-hydroxy-2-oxoglutarate aldolase